MNAHTGQSRHIRMFGYAPTPDAVAARLSLRHFLEGLSEPLR